ncbi:hypothetical protein WAI453_006451 [Rhynchosporium graminicola]
MVNSLVSDLNMGLSKLSKEIESLTQHKLSVTDALRRSIRLNAKLSSNDMRAAIGKVLDMVSLVSDRKNTSLHFYSVSSRMC